LRLLALSDVHGNVSAVTQLRRKEANRFDGVVVAGDIGAEAAPEIIQILSTFECPVLYIFGNWDSELAYEAFLGQNCYHLHLKLAKFGPFYFSGFSGCDANWGRNPFAMGEFEREGASKRNRRALAELLYSESVNPRQTVIVTHERLYRTHEDLKGIGLFLFGHRHGFSDTRFRQSRFVNVPALDMPVTVKPLNKIDTKHRDFRNINNGRYVVLEGDRLDDIRVESVKFGPSFVGWERLENEIWHGIPWLESTNIVMQC
jgi:predicted phosphodiesterase